MPADASRPTPVRPGDAAATNGGTAQVPDTGTDKQSGNQQNPRGPRGLDQYLYSSGTSTPTEGFTGMEDRDKRPVSPAVLKFIEQAGSSSGSGGVSTPDGGISGGGKPSGGSADHSGSSGVAGASNGGDTGDKGSPTPTDSAATVPGGSPTAFDSKASQPAPAGASLILGAAIPASDSGAETPPTAQPTDSGTVESGGTSNADAVAPTEDKSDGSRAAESTLYSVRVADIGDAAGDGNTVQVSQDGHTYFVGISRASDNGVTTVTIGTGNQSENATVRLPDSVAGDTKITIRESSSPGKLAEIEVSAGRPVIDATSSNAFDVKLSTPFGPPTPESRPNTQLHSSPAPTDQPTGSSRGLPGKEVAPLDTKSEDYATPEQEWEVAKESAWNWFVDRLGDTLGQSLGAAGAALAPGLGLALGQALAPVVEQHGRELVSDLRYPEPPAGASTGREHELRESYDAMQLALSTVEIALSVVAPWMAESAIESGVASRAGGLAAELYADTRGALKISPGTSGTKAGSEAAVTAEAKAGSKVAENLYSNLEKQAAASAAKTPTTQPTSPSPTAPKDTKPGGTGTPQPTDLKSFQMPSDLEETLQFVVHDAGFAQGKATPPNVSTYNGTDARRFGSWAHNNELGEAVKRAQDLNLPHADRLVNDVRVAATGKVLEVGVPPGGKKGDLNFDLVLLREGATLQKGDTLQSKAVLTADAKYGGLSTNQGQATFASRHGLTHVNLRAGDFQAQQAVPR